MFFFQESDHLPSTTAPAPMPSYCLTSNGHRYEEGESWHDGCRDCYCLAGREMCVLISCPVPSCTNLVVRPDQCCPTCEGTSCLEPPGLSTHTYTDTHTGLAGHSPLGSHSPKSPLTAPVVNPGLRLHEHFVFL